MSGATLRRVRIGVGIAFAMLLTMPYPVAAKAPDSSAPIRVPAKGLPASATSWIVTMRPGADAGVAGPTIAKDAGGGAGMIFRHALHGFVFNGSTAAADVLRRNPNVRSVVANGRIAAQAEPVPTGVSRILANHATKESAYSDGFRGNGVKVAILDTGIDLTHPDLVPNLDIALGRNCMTSGPPQDGHGHGTHVAGIVAAAANGIGVVGVAPEATLVPIKVLDDTGSGEWSNLICAVDYLTGLMTDGDPTNDVRVANMSLGDVGTIGTCTDGGIREAICHSVAAGVVYVAAAGNSTVDTSTFIPAAFPEVIAVSALTDLDGASGGQGGCWLFFFYCDDTLAEFSNFGSTVAVTAPGTQIYSDWTGGGYATEMGTSMASPHVAGVAALMLAANPTLSPTEVRDLLVSTGECPNGALADADGSGDCIGKGQWGNDPDGIAEPLVNALNAVESLSGDRRPVVKMTSPTDGATVSGSVAVTATATDDIGVTKVEFFVNGSLLATDSNGSNGWSTTWDTSGLDGGRYTLRATATDTAGQTRSSSVGVQTGANRQGSWRSSYGGDGYLLANWDGTSDLTNLPAGVTSTLVQGARYTWAATTTDVRALQSPTTLERRSQTWYDVDSLRMRLDFSAPYNGTLHLYAVDWDAFGGNRYEDITVNDGSGPRKVSLSFSFVPGAWVHVPIAVGAGGSVTITVDRTAGNSAVLAGLFLGGAGAPPPPPLPVDSPGVQGSWRSSYGVDGSLLANWDGTNDLNNLPAGVTSTLVQGGRATWVSPTTDVRALQGPTGTERRSRTWYDANEVRLRLDFGTAYSGTLHLYAVDWDAYGGNRYEDITVNDGSGPRTASLSSSFVQGAWIHVPISVAAGGSVTITIDKTAGYSAVLAGLFLGGPPPPPPPPMPVDSPGVQGTWRGSFGADGYLLGAWDGTTDLNNLPAGVTPTLEAGGRATWVSPTTDVRALTDPTGTERRSRTWYDASEVRLRLTFSSPYSGNLHLYAVDWDAYGGNRYEDITVNDGSGPRTANLSSSFVQGAWVHVPITVGAGGSVLITVDKTAGYSAVLAGLFLGGTNPTPPPAPTAPGAPTGLTATPGNGQVVLAWVAPASNGGSPITGYTATAAPGGATCTSPTPGCTVSGLTNGTPYTFTVVAANAVGPGPASAPASATPIAPPTAPGAPTGLTATPGNGQVVLAWVAPASTGGSPITGYTATAAPGGATCTSPTPGCTVSGLTNGTPYTFTVVAANAVGPGPASAPASATPIAPPTAPGAPTGLTATPGNGQVVLAWVAPASTGGSPITGYTATAAPGGATCTSPTPGCTVSGLTNGTPYTFTVVAANAVGPGPASAPASATPIAPPTAPGAPTGLTATPGNGQVVLAWVAPASTGGSPITGYTATAAPGGATCTSPTPGCTVSGLTNGTPYTFTVVAANAVGPGPASAPASATPIAPPTAPGAPTGLTATPGNGQVVLAWVAPASTGGSPITGYTATAAPGGATCTSPTPGCTVSGLTNGTPYTFTVVAANAVGPGPASAPASATPIAPPTAPGAPTGLTATPGNGQVVLAWVAPASTGGSPITGYRVYRATASGGETLLATLTNVTTYTDTSVTNGTTYYYQVAARNVVGYGARSAEASAKPATVPGAPRNPRATRSATLGVNLTWTAPSSTGGASITAYRIYRSTSTGTETFLVAIGNVLSYVDTATSPGVRYYYKISAVNPVGEGARSAETNALAR